MLTLVDKIWNSHMIADTESGPMLFVDLHFVHELSPQAFSGLRERGLPVRRPDLTVATMDHNVPTTDPTLPVVNELAAQQMAALRTNCDEFGITLFGRGDPHQGIVHVLGPERGLTQPGMIITCGDSHTATHGALGALAFGIGTTQVEQVLASQCIAIPPPKTMAVEVSGRLSRGVTAKDLALTFIRHVGFGGATGHIAEYRGQAIEDLSMEARMTLCNMSTEAGARAGVIAPDEKTIAYIRGREHAPHDENWSAATEYWSTLRSDPDVTFDAVVALDAARIEPTVTWGTTPAMSVAVTGVVPEPGDTPDPEQAERALQYMGLRAGQRISDITLDRVFIGSCTNSRIEDLREVAAIVQGKQVHPDVRVLVVPGSAPVKNQAETEGLDKVFRAAGMEWRQPGCSMCLAMNGDVLSPGERCASTSNRNFEGRQGAGGRTHLVSPAMAAAAAVAGRFVDVREV
jgi:3-isopropylmalate/(R)-2-methylmalate dehydratase large subunit